MPGTSGSYLKLSEEKGGQCKHIDDNLSEWKHNFTQVNQDLVPLRDPITFSWYQINAYSLRKEGEGTASGIINLCLNRQKQTDKQILKNVSGVADPGELFVLMGSSGAGKTTLLNCITFRNIKYLKITGLVQMNDVPVTQTELASQSAYVQQEDLFVPYLTVREHMIFQARLRMGNGYTNEHKMQRVEDVMAEFSLTKCQHVMIGKPGVIKGISGGERKRLALASELLMNPSLLFCDEPTTGLDSFMALNIMQTLKNLARSGRTVICTLHQPSSELFGLFDKICLMAEGRTAFLGTLEQAEEFLSKLNAKCPPNYCPGDYYIQLLSIIPGQEEACRRNVGYICDAYEKSTKGSKIRRRSRSVTIKPDGKQWENNISSINTYKVGWWAQFQAVLWRCWLSLMKCPEMTTHKLFFYSSITIFISVIYYHQKLDTFGVQNICGVLYLFLVFLNSKNLSGVILSFCTELPLFLREHKNGLYRTDVYFLSKCLVDLPLTVLFDIMFTGVCYICIGLNHDVTRLFINIAVTSVYACIVVGMGYILSVAAPNPVIAQTMLPVLIMPATVLGGFFLNIESIPPYIRWLTDFSWFRWANTALMINQWSDIKGINCTEPLGDCFRNGNEVLQKFGLAGPTIDVRHSYLSTRTTFSIAQIRSVLSLVLH
ncbi:hypothetical protein WA026_000870 [Henosepilachna vigintioctopunctata]|uniref:Protein white n=1 Tax=Henosepilachna vigintioctopunctata TaxID=420089 RepID=A0AAW1V5J6_9CUCU